MLRRLIGEDVEIVTRLAPEPGNVMADPLQLGQVLMNLAINARDAMPGGGQIVIETCTQGNRRSGGERPAGEPGRYAVLSVADTGVGNESGDSGEDFRAVLYHQRRGHGHRTRLEHRVRHRAPGRRLDRRAELARQRFAIRDLAAR